MKTALAQTNIISENKEANKLTAKKMVTEAALGGCRIIIFPEVSLTGFSMNMDKLAEPADNSETIRFFSRLAYENKIFISFGAALYDSDGSMKNYAVTVDDSGKVVCKYAKIHPYSHGVEGKFFAKGDSVKYFDIDGITVSTFLCYDLRFPEIFQAVSEKSRLIILMTNWPDVRIQHLDLLLRARAVENQSFFAAVNRAGKEMKYIYPGHSQIVSPTGQVLTPIREDEALIMYDIDIAEADSYRSSYHLKADRRPELYKKIL
ncbi:MAG: carbon-nitrogen family hydrolase [Clostridia bacterium]|nr:carbon-nitrogen family hydrolase [Clostridia bacterium]